MLPVPARAGACETWAAKAVSVQGIVEARPAGAARWTTVKLDNTLCPGDMVRVKANGRASLVLSNDTILRLDQNTTVTFSVITQDEPSQLDVLDGIAHFISRVRQSFKVITPFVNAAVEGTEFVVAARTDESQITVFEGRVLARNPQGQIRLSSGQSAVARAGQAPVMRALVRPRDAVQWALYYPPILDYDPERFRGVPAPGQSRLRDSIEAYRRGDAAAALNRIAGLPDTLADARVYTYRASLRLAVGRVEEAKTDLKRALALNPRQSDALALSAMIAVVQNDRAKARSLAEQAVAADPGSATAKLALSYAQQAEFDIEGALASVQQAIDHQPNNALAWARLAELRLSLGELKQALLTARRATEINPMLARTQSVLGFAYLTQIKVKKAKQAFQRAIELDQSDPLSRLGLGLAIIRQGELKEGRRQIELAASLDPNNALIRSYLGKAYYEEKRDRLAADQLAMAKDLDPNDPTPWFYDAIRKDAENRPVEALHDVQKSIEINDNRAVYRSRLLLDEDLAARSASLARIYKDIRFGQLAQLEASKSLNSDPANHSAHRFLSDSYASRPRHEVARVSELLQSQLLQPININPVQPQLAETNLNILSGAGPADAAFNEFTPLFTRDQVRLNASGFIGNNETWGDEVVVSGIVNQFSYSLGQFHYETDGFRENNDVEHDILNIFAQAALTSKVGVQFEFRQRETNQGDRRLIFDPNEFVPTDRRGLEQDSARFGLHIMPSPRTDFIFSLTHVDRDTTFDREAPPFFVSSQINQDGYDAEGQYLFRGARYNITAGVGTSEIDDESTSAVGFGSPSPLPPPVRSTDDQDNAYFYANVMLHNNVIGTLGVSYDSVFDVAYDREFDETSPKFGLLWNVSDHLRLRAATFKTLKGLLISGQTIEPTQIAGFNQFFDDVNATEAEFYGIALDAVFTRNLYGGIEGSRRDLVVPNVGATVVLEEREEDFYHAYLYWTPHSDWALSTDYQFEKFEKEFTNLIELETTSVPVALRYFSPTGIFAELATTYVTQKVGFDVDPGFDKRRETFIVADAALGYRLPNRRGIVSLEAKNLFNEDFIYQDLAFVTADPFNFNPRYIPDRTIFARITLSF